ncbi:dynamin family protein [Clostridium sp. CX1]|uniref:dynamin family protein n=1 Tax=Clostridium sp. CX1 TaxID=2978346 RepID=UPI0021BE577F|nr:dynamin family protein [Clostridium sp. CX1]MCT8977442.1 dynamin family protein [Clostridium sp. CX1]
MKDSAIALKYKEIFSEYILISERYGLPVDSIKDNIHQIDNFRVTTPVVGGFSTGKSSMINALLGKDILPVEITPETAIPTEITYGHNKVQLYQNDEVKEISIDDLRNGNFNVDNTKLIRLEYENDFLEIIQAVKIVDMPGFDSGIEIHNKSINNYLSNSLAYILTFSAEEPVIKESIANFLNELKIYDVPVYVVITKCDKVTKSTLEEVKKFLKVNIPKVLNIPNIKIVCVEAQDDIDVPELKEILKEIQKNSDKIFETEFSRKLKANLKPLENYLVSRINNSKLSVSELDEKIKALERQIDNIMSNLEKEKNTFDIQAQKCIDKIKQRIETDLRAASQSLESMMLNGSDIKDKVNMIVRSAVMNGVKTELEPRLQKYLKNVTELIDVNILQDTNIELNGIQVAADNMVKNVILNSLPIAFAAIGSAIATIPALAALGSFAGPLGVIIGGAIGAFVESAFKSKQENDRRELARQKVQNEIIPGTVEQTSISVETEIKAYIAQVNDEIFANIKEQKRTMQKALEDNKQKKLLEEQQNQQELEEINADLLKIRSVVNGL